MVQDLGYYPVIGKEMWVQFSALPLTLCTSLSFSEGNWGIRRINTSFHLQDTEVLKRLEIRAIQVSKLDKTAGWRQSQRRREIKSSYLNVSYWKLEKRGIETVLGQVNMPLCS